MEVERPAAPTPTPTINLIKRSDISGRRLGVFAASFNPPTVAHVELIRYASVEFSLDETLALVSRVNADKVEYECPLEDRIAMLRLAFEDDPRVAIGLSSHAFYVDMVEAIRGVYPPQTDLHFIVGFDTFERVIDLEGRYTSRYHLRFASRVEALQYLFARSRFIVAARAGAGRRQIEMLLKREPAVPPERILYLDFPAELGEVSATNIRGRCRLGEPITGLVSARVEHYIHQRGLYDAVQVVDEHEEGHAQS